MYDHERPTMRRQSTYKHEQCVHEIELCIYREQILSDYNQTIHTPFWSYLPTLPYANMQPYYCTPNLSLFSGKSHKFHSLYVVLFVVHHSKDRTRLRTTPPLLDTFYLGKYRITHSSIHNKLIIQNPL